MCMMFRFFFLKIFVESLQIHTKWFEVQIFYETKQKKMSKNFSTIIFHLKTIEQILRFFKHFFSGSMMMMMMIVMVATNIIDQQTIDKKFGQIIWFWSFFFDHLWLSFLMFRIWKKRIRISTTKTIEIENVKKHFSFQTFRPFYTNRMLLEISDCFSTINMVGFFLLMLEHCCCSEIFLFQRECGIQYIIYIYARIRILKECTIRIFFSVMKIMMK